MSLNSHISINQPPSKDPSAKLCVLHTPTVRESSMPSIKVQKNFSTVEILHAYSGPNQI